MKKILLTLVLISATLPVFAASLPMWNNAKQNVWDTPTQYFIELDYLARTDGQPIYVGFANYGATTSESVWLLYKFTYDGSDQLTLRQIAHGSWDNRATASYTP